MYFVRRRLGVFVLCRPELGMEAFFFFFLSCGGGVFVEVRVGADMYKLWSSARTTPGWSVVVLPDV